MEIGFTATCVLTAWYGGRSVYVPTSASEDHVLALLVGMPALRRLIAFCDEMDSPDRVLCMPVSPMVYAQKVRRDLRVVELMRRKGASAEMVAGNTGLTVRRVQQIVATFQTVESEILEQIRRHEIPGRLRVKTSRKKPPRKSPQGKTGGSVVRHSIDGTTSGSGGKVKASNTPALVLPRKRVGKR